MKGRLSLKITENNESYMAMLPSLKQARFGSYLILPFQFEEGTFRKEWVNRTMTASDVTTMDLNEIARSMMSEDGRISVGCCWQISRDVLFREMTDDTLTAEQTSLYVESDGIRRRFSLTDSRLYVFHSRVAFFALGILYDEISALAAIVSPGYANSRAVFVYENASGSHSFAIEEWIEHLMDKAGLRKFFSSKGSPFLEAFTYTLGLVPQRFPDLSVMRQAVFNLHLMEPLDDPVTDSSEEDVRFVYSVIDRKLNSYRWATCITSQTISYIVADPEMNLDAQMQAQAEDGLPLVMLALYEKYTCLHYTEVIATTDLSHLRQIQKLKTEMLEFQAYGTLAPANLSRWHNVKHIYSALLEVNAIPEAINDVDHKINILSEHQRELESQRAELLTNLITAFGIISILASVLTIIQILLGGNFAIWASLILTTVFIFLVFLLAIYRRKR